VTNANVSNDSIELLCNRCGHTFSAFLHQMADQNSKVVCPNCRESVDCNPPKAVKPPARII
jgi:DNA-directed RNA polymerase subunit RPC12/RpoP